MSGNKNIRSVIRDNLDSLLSENRMTQKELADRMGVSASTVNDWVRGKKIPRMDKVDRICNIFGVNRERILYAPDNDTRRIEPSPSPAPEKPVTRYTFRVPVLGRIAAGTPILAQQEIIDYEYIDERLNDGDSQYFCLVVEGKSMEPTIHDGDTIVVRVQSEVENGQIAVVLVDGEDATVKEVKESADGLTLIGHNVAVYRPHFYSRAEVSSLPVRIVGRVIRSISKFD